MSACLTSIGLKTTPTACGGAVSVFLVAVVLLTELSTKFSDLAVTDTTEYYSRLFSVATKKPTAWYLKSFRFLMVWLAALLALLQVGIMTSTWPE